MAREKKTVIKVHAPESLKHALRRAALERHISVAALARLVLAEYLREKR
jgi:hypothetical protein